MAEEQDGIDWVRFSQDKLYRALATEHGLPPPLPAGYKIDIPRFRVDAGYRAMLMKRGITRKDDPVHEAEIEALFRQRRGFPPPEGYDDRPGKVIRIDDPRFRVRRPHVLSMLHL